MTWKPSQDIVDAALAHAEACQPAESCGVVANGSFIPIANLSTDLDAFVMDMRAYLDLDKTVEIEAIVHSHIYAPPIASDADKTMCEAMGKPWLIVGWPTRQWDVIEPCGFKAPLVGRKWAWGPHDCWGLIRDGFTEFTGIELPDFDRNWLWWERGDDLITKQFVDAGFVEVEGDWRHCDVIGMQIWPSKVVNHLGLFLAPDLILHQLLGRSSVRQVYGGIFAQATVLHLRHRELLNHTPEPPVGHPLWSVR